MMGAPRNHPVVRLSPHPCYDFTARFASPIALASIANDPCYPPILHADRPPATLHCGPARFLADLPSLLSTGASVIRQLLLAFYTCETRGRGPSCSPVSLKHTGGDNRAWSRAALLVPSGAPGALLRRIPLARGYGEKKHIVFKELFCHDDLNARSCRPSRKRRLPALGGGGVAAMINLRTAFSGGADLPFPPTLPLPLHHLDPGLFDPASMAIELINYMVVPDSPRNPSLVDR
ncbi:unnamed protein product [Penicillium manginii]